MGSQILNFFVGSLGSIGDSIISSLGAVGGLFKQFGKSIDLSGITDWITSLFSGVEDKIAPDLIPAKNAVSQFFTTNKASLGLDDNTLAEVEKSGQQVVKDFYSANPKLNKDGLPEVAFDKVLNWRKQLKTLFDESIDLRMDNRESLIERLLTVITGVPTDSDKSSLAKSFPTSGMAGLLVNMQNMRGGETPVTIKEGDLTMNFIDAKPVKLPENLPTKGLENTNPKTVKTNEPPPNTPPVVTMKNPIVIHRPKTK